MSEHVDIKAGISMHPSHPGVINRLLENEENILKEVRYIQFSHAIYKWHFYLGNKFNFGTISIHHTL